MKALVISGGAMRGAFSVPILRRLSDSGKLDDFDFIFGTSIGAINGAFACQGQIEDLELLWSKMNSENQAIGVPGAFSPRWFTIAMSMLFPSVSKSIGLSQPGSVFSTDGIRGMANKYLDPNKLMSRFFVNVTSRVTSSGLTIEIKKDGKKEDYVNLVMGSSAMGAIFPPVEMEINGVFDLLSDGGHTSSIPDIPESILDNLSEIVVITHFMLDAPDFKLSQVDGFLDAIKWVIGLQYGQQYIRARNEIASYADRGILVRVFSPKKPLGGLLDASKEIMGMRREHGVEVARTPITLKSNR